MLTETSVEEEIFLLANRLLQISFCCWRIVGIVMYTVCRTVSIIFSFLFGIGFPCHHASRHSFHKKMCCRQYVDEEACSFNSLDFCQNIRSNWTRNIFKIRKKISSFASCCFKLSSSFLKLFLFLHSLLFSELNSPATIAEYLLFLHFFSQSSVLILLKSEMYRTADTRYTSVCCSDGKKKFRLSSEMFLHWEEGEREKHNTVWLKWGFLTEINISYISQSLWSSLLLSIVHFTIFGSEISPSQCNDHDFSLFLKFVKMFLFFISFFLTWRFQSYFIVLAAGIVWPWILCDMKHSRK